MARWAARTGWLMLLLAAPAAASAQGRTCDLVEPTDYRQIVNLLGEEIVYFRGPVRLECEGGIELDSDSAVYNRGRLQIELIGQVEYRDSTHQLTSDWAMYIGEQEQLIARRDVVITDLMDGSVVTGHEMDYLRETPDRPTSRVVMRGDRPRAVLREARRERPPPDDADEPAPAIRPPGPDTIPPVEITADRLESHGDSLFRAIGDVDLVRGEMTGAADSSVYRRYAEHLALFGEAHVEEEQYRLEGQRIDAYVAGEVVEEVVAVDSARLFSEDLTVRSERLRIGFAEGEVDRIEAWNPVAVAGDAGEDDGDAEEPAVPATRAVAVAEDFELRADSIDARADGGELRELRAVGRAYGERPPDVRDRGAPAVATRDWIQGDTVIGYFARLEPEVEPDPLPGEVVTAGDTAEVVLERVEVIGGSQPALSLYRMEDADNGGQAAINFTRAVRIILHLAEGEVSVVEAEGPLDGLHLDPLPERAVPDPEQGVPAPGQEPPPDTTGGGGGT